MIFATCGVDMCSRFVNHPSTGVWVEQGGCMRRALAVAIVMMSGAGIGVVHVQTPSHARASSGCSVKAVTFKNWKAEEISNSLVRLTLVPQLGGRLMQVTF